MYSNEIQIPFNIQRALFYFQNDKLLSLLAAVIARYASYMLCSPPSIIHFPLCPGLLAPTPFAERRSSRAVIYRTTTSGKFLRLKTRYNGTSRPPRRASYCRLWNKSGGPYRILPKFQMCIVARDTLWYCLSTDCINFPYCHHFQTWYRAVAYSGYPCRGKLYFYDIIRR